MDLFDELKKILVKELSTDAEAVTLEAHLVDDLGADSYTLVALVDIIEEKYKIDIELDDIVEFENIGELVKFVDERK